MGTDTTQRAAMGLRDVMGNSNDHNEIDLVLLCASMAPKFDAIGSLLGVAIDWPRLLQIALRHRVLPLLFWNLSRTHPELVPAGVLDRLRDSYRENAARNLLLAGHLKRLLPIFSEQQIPVIPYKGPAMALMAYANVSLRTIGDLDLLVRQVDYARACALLQSRGYRCTADWGWESSFVDATGRVCIDLHKSITSAYFPVRFDFNRLYRRLVQVHGPCGEIHTLSPEDMLIVLCVQVAKDSHAQTCALNKLCDIAELLRSQPKLEWSRVDRESKRLGCQRVLGLGLHLARKLLDAPRDSNGVAVPAGPWLGTAAAHIASRMFGSAESARPDAAAQRHYYLALRERWRDRVAPDLYRWHSDVLMPNDKDRALLRLPGTLEKLYYVLRPVRLARDWGIKALRTIIHRAGA